MDKYYPGLVYDSSNYKNVFEKLNAEESYYLTNQRDQTHYAYISWRMHYGGMSQKYKEQGEGYLVSTIILLEQCLKENRDRKGDAVIFPILFSIEQGIELYIKALIILIGENNITINESITTHDIKRLVSLFKNAISSENETLSNIACCDFDYLDRFVELLFEKTDDCTYARFPDDRSHNEHFYVNSNENIIVDMRILLNWVKSIFYILDRNFINLASEFESRGETGFEV